MAKHLEGKAAVVTGGGGGIGRAVCLELAHQGAQVVVNDLGGDPFGTGSSHQPADEVVQEIREMGGDAAAVYDTVATMEGGEKVIKSALNRFGHLEILVHIAGIVRDRMVFNMSEEEWDAVIAVHLKGMFTTAKHAAILFRQQRSGRIIGFSSGSGLMGNIGQCNYGAAKDGIAGFIRTAARDLGKYGVTCNVIAPVATTRLTATIPSGQGSRAAQAGVASPSYDPSMETDYWDPADVAPMVAYLCTDDAKDINGQMFWVQGRQISLLNNPYASKTMQKRGRWTLEEIATLFPTTLGKDLVNSAPPQPRQRTESGAGAGDNSL